MVDTSHVYVSPEFEGVIEEAIDERLRQIALGKDEYGERNEITVNDLLATAMAYAGRAAEAVARNEREGAAAGFTQREMLLKAATVLLAAVEGVDRETLFSVVTEGAS